MIPFKLTRIITLWLSEYTPLEYVINKTHPLNYRRVSYRSSVVLNLIEVVDELAIEHDLKRCQFSENVKEQQEKEAIIRD